MPDPSPTDAAKAAAAAAAIALVRDGMRVGLGTGSTASIMVRLLAERARAERLTLRCVATSTATAALATGLGLRVEPLDTVGHLDLTIDGADEIDPDLTLVKGGGGAHLREKIVAASSDRLIVIADPGKVVEQLGAFALPVEVTPFGIGTTRERMRAALDDLGLADVPIFVRQAGGGDLVTDEGNRIIDLSLGAIPDAAALDRALRAVPGVIETGLFIDMAEQVIIGKPDGSVVVLKRLHRDADPTHASGEVVDGF